MKPRLVPIFAVTVALALASVTDASWGKGGGGGRGGGGHGGGGHGGGGHGGGHVAGGHFGGRHGHYAGGHYGGHHGHYAAGGHHGGHGGHYAAGGHYGSHGGHYAAGGHGNRFARASQFSGRGGASRNAFGNHAAWNHWAGGGGSWGGWGGGWGGWGGWVGPVFWPFLLGDILSYVLWPYDYYYPFWSYGSYAGYYYSAYTPAYDYSGYGYGSGGLSDIYGYSRSGYSRHAGRTSHNAAQADQIPADVTQSCGGFAPGVTSFPIDRMREAIRPSGSQSAALDELATASSKASSIVVSSCPSEPPLTPLARLDAVEQRLDAMIQAVQIVRPALARLYDSLSDEQRQRLEALGTEESRNEAATAPTGAGLATLCDRQAASFTKLPVQGIEEIVRPKDQQQTAFENLKQASAQAADELKTSCPAQTAATPVARLDAAGDRLQALVQAAKTVRPTLGAFYASLSDEQKARFNSMGQRNGTQSQSTTGIR